MWLLKVKFLAPSRPELLHLKKTNWKENENDVASMDFVELWFNSQHYKDQLITQEADILKLIVSNGGR